VLQRPTAPVRILVADPDETSARQLELALVAEPSVEVVGWAGSCAQVLDLVSSRATDVVLLAVDLPAARETLDQLVKLPPQGPKVILMAGRGTSSRPLDGKGVNEFVNTADVAGFLRKTAEVSDMVTLVIALVALAGVPSEELNGSKS